MNVLIVERDDFQRGGLRWLLMNADLGVCMCSEAKASADFRDQVARQSFDLIVLDVDGLDEDDWVHVARAAKTSAVIGVTARRDFALAVRCLEVGVYRLLTKPLDIPALLEAVQAASSLRQGKGGTAREQRKRHWVTQLISGQVTNLRDVWDEALALGCAALPTAVLVGKICRFQQLTRNRSDAWKMRALEEVYAAVEGYCAEHGLIAALLQDEVVVLYTPQKGETRQEVVRNVKRIGRALIDRVYQATGYGLFVACGGEYKDPKHLYHSYSEAKRLLALQFYFAHGYVCHVSDYPHLFAENVLDTIAFPVFGDEFGVEQLPVIYAEVENALQGMKAKGVSPLYFQLALLYFLLRVLKRVVPNERERFRSFLARGAEVLSSESADELLERLRAYLADVSATGAVSPRHLVIERALAYIHTHYDQGLTLEQVAAKVNRSPFYFSHLFKKEMNMTFVEYVTHLRVQKAKELMQEGDVTIAEVAAKVGYQDPNYFSRVFKAITGLSPTQWKAQYGRETAKSSNHSG